jgi:hypothetical protein
MQRQADRRWYAQFASYLECNDYKAAARQNHGEILGIESETSKAQCSSGPKYKALQNMQAASMGE